MILDSHLPSRIFLSFLLLLLSLACASPGYAIPDKPLRQNDDGKEVTGTASRKKGRSSMQIYIGGRHLSDGALWGPVDDQVVFGSEFDWIEANGVFGFEIGFQASFASENEEIGISSVDQEGGTTELYLGPRFDTALFGSSFHLVAGAGPSLLNARRSQEINGSMRSDSEGSLGLYTHFGLVLDLGEFGLGLDYRLRWGANMTGFEDVFGTQFTGDADYGQLALTFALQF